MHPAVELLVKRMESNPEEFYDRSRRNLRWERIMSDYESYFSEEERTAVKSKYAQLQLERMHKDIMSELLNGEEEERVLTGVKEQRKLFVNQAQLAALQNQSQLAALQNQAQLAALNPWGLNVPQGQNLNLPIQNGGIQSSTSLRLGREVLDELTIKKIKDFISK